MVTLTTQNQDVVKILTQYKKVADKPNVRLGKPVIIFTKRGSQTLCEVYSVDWRLYSSFGEFAEDYQTQTDTLIDEKQTKCLCMFDTTSKTWCEWERGDFDFGLEMTSLNSKNRKVISDTVKEYPAIAEFLEL